MSPVASAAVAGLFYDDLARGQRFDALPAVTVTSGMAAVHQALLGDRLPLALDRGLAGAVADLPDGMVHPALVWDVAIGQSTVVTQRVIANLYYRGLVLRRAVGIGDTLITDVEVVGLRDARPKPGAAPAGRAALRIVTRDQDGHVVLDFERCALLPCRPGSDLPGHADDLEAEAAVAPSTAELAVVADGWDAAPLAPLAPAGLGAGTRVGGELADTVTGATELARLTLNVAAVHHDPRARGKRLVYGGHTVGLAAAQLVRALPGVVFVSAWRSCDHLAPVHEGDVLTSDVEVVDVEPLGDFLAVEVRVTTSAWDADGGARAVLDWRPILVMR